jgi:hypothetical protein
MNFQYNFSPAQTFLQIEGTNMKVWPASRIPAALLMLLPFLLAATAQPQRPSPSTGAPRFSLAITLPQDAIRGDSEIPLEVTMTNTSDGELWYGVAFAPPLWTRLCRLDVRDGEGRLLERRPAMQQFFGSMEGGPALVLRVGEKVTVEVLLNRVYDLSKPGKYTIQAIRNDDGITVKSNILTASLPGSEVRTVEAKPPVSLTLSTPYSEVKTGYQVPVRIAVENISKKKITLRSWQEDTKVGAGTGHEFSSGIAVRDPQGNPAPRTKKGQVLDGETDFPAGRFTFISLAPGESYEEARIVGELYDLNRPGKYSFQVGLSDPKTNLVVRSNPVTVSVLGAEGNIQPGREPPFLLDIRPIEEPAKHGWNFNEGIYLAITNRSDHPIDFDIAFGDNDVDVYDSHGKLAPLTETGRQSRGRLQDPAKRQPPTQHLQPGETKSGGAIDLDALYDLTHLDRYTVQVRAFDDETKSIVASNRITVTK